MSARSQPFLGASFPAGLSATVSLLLSGIEMSLSSGGRDVMLVWKSSKFTEGRKSKEPLLVTLLGDPSEVRPKLKGELLA